jgi:putative transposase
LATHISRTRTTPDAQMLMKKAYDRVGKIPRVIYTDALRAYLDGIELQFGGDTKHKQGSPFDVESNTNLIERFQGTLKDRTKIMRGLKDIKTAKLFTDGWLLYYNYLRPHESLGGKTPAQIAGVKYPYLNWQDIVAGRKIETISQANATSYTAVPELPRGTKYMILRRRITKRPKRQKQKIQLQLSGVRI